jgi:hypothetical protein
MANIILLRENDASEIRLMKRSLIGLRDCYPNFENWFDSKIVPNINNGKRQLFLATQNSEFAGALILKNDLDEKKICTCFVNPKYRLNHLGLDFIRIASEELETYKLPISVSDEAKSFFMNNLNFNFYTTKLCTNHYKENINEYFGYIMFKNLDKELKKEKKYGV